MHWHPRRAWQAQQFRCGEAADEVIETGRVVRGDGLALSDRPPPPRFELAQGLAQGVFEVVIDWTTARAWLGGKRSVNSSSSKARQTGRTERARVGPDFSLACAAETCRIIGCKPADLGNQISFDPDPFSRTLPVPNNRIDSVTSFAHAYGHALVFNGSYATATGALPADYISTYDDLCRLSGPTPPGGLASSRGRNGVSYRCWRSP